MNHPKPSILRIFLQTLTVADAGLVLHLLECPRCSRQGWGLLSPRPVRRRPGEPRSPAPEPERYERAFARMAEKMSHTAAQVEKGRRRAEPLVAELLALPLGERHAHLAAGHRFRTVFVAWKLLERSWQVADATEAESLARLAASIAQKLAARESGTGVETGLAIGAWCAAGEACRRAGRLEDADEALVRAVPHLEKSIDPLESAEYCHTLARVRRDQRRFDEAKALLERAAALFGGAGQTRDQALALIDLAAVFLDQEDWDAAVTVFDRVLALGAAAVDAGLALGGGWGIAGCLAALGDPLRGRRILALLAERPARRRTAVDRAVLVRIEGLLAALSRHEHQAEVLLREAWNAFHRSGAAGYAILVGLDLAALFLRQGRGANLRALGGEIRIAFQSRDLAGGVRAAVDDLVRALEEGEVRPEQLAGIARIIARAMVVS
ncbi:MAG TPA: tetratricopeptide repeat protein [Thermoanaerobaculia bacterium]|nr:tetratricopeptide repeat protein [Thermoanaerobaculia bacterium]